MRARPLPPSDPIESWLLERVLPKDHELLRIRAVDARIKLKRLYPGGRE